MHTLFFLEKSLEFGADAIGALWVIESDTIVKAKLEFENLKGKALI